ncbi:MAG: MBL fold metallo-hydrolase, partial [Bacteroidales bacterium]|nr:MBL fold metallo-hydrolase [Bacteroidales bacterium]
MGKITFLGTGTSQGIPMIGCTCKVCKSADPRDNRLRTSALVEHNGFRILIDCGPDFRQQMLRQNISDLDAVILTHQHKDHTGGMDDIRAFNYFRKAAFPIYAEPNVQESLKMEYSYAFAEHKYPGVPD